MLVALRVSSEPALKEPLFSGFFCGQLACVCLCWKCFGPFADAKIVFADCKSSASVLIACTSGQAAWQEGSKLMQFMRSILKQACVRQKQIYRTAIYRVGFV